MSLATRCPHCGTIFRVVQDQLKVSEGWVRCGQCQEIFHGVEALFELAADPQPADESSASVPASSARNPTSTFGERVAARMAASSGFEHEREHEHQHGLADGFGLERESQVGPGIAAASAAYPIEPMPMAEPKPEPKPEPETFVVDEGPVSEAAITWLPDSPEAIAPSEASHASASTDDGDELIEIAEFVVEDADSTSPPEWPVGPGDVTTTTEPATDLPIDPAADAGPAIPDDRLPALVDTQTHELALAQADDLDDDEERGGPQTLAAMLPDAVEGWPPKRRASRPAPLPAIEARQREAAARGDPRFVREARRGERWTRPWVRASLGLVLFVLVIAAAAQVAWPLRDVVAARWPETRPALVAACDLLACTIEAPRSLASLALDGSSLTRTDADHVLLFSADLHNRSDHAVRMPSFDLSFTDLNGQVVARKVLAPNEVGIRQGSLGPDVELHVHARLQVTDLDATGFQAEMFYP